MPPMMPGMPPMVAQYPTAGAGAVYPPGYTVASQIGAPQMVAPPQMAAAYAPPSVSMSAPGPPGVAVSAAPTVQHATTATPVIVALFSSYYYIKCYHYYYYYYYHEFSESYYKKVTYLTHRLKTIST